MIYTEDCAYWYGYMIGRKGGVGKKVRTNSFNDPVRHPIADPLRYHEAYLIGFDDGEGDEEANAPNIVLGWDARPDVARPGDIITCLVFELGKCHMWLRDPLRTFGYGGYYQWDAHWKGWMQI